MGKKRPDIWSGIFWLLISAIVCLESYRYGLGKMSGPGPGLIPFGAGLGLACFSLLLLINAVFKESFSPEKDWFKGILWRRSFITLVSLLAYTFLLEYLGFVICTFALIFILTFFVLPQPYKKAFIIAITSTVASYLIFEVWLKVQLPRGFLGV